MKWIDVNDELPKEGARVLVTCIDSKSPITASFVGGNFEIDLRFFRGSVITHWQPLPEMPIEYLKSRER